jgi:hypothetical protein
MTPPLASGARASPLCRPPFSIPRRPCPGAYPPVTAAQLNKTAAKQTVDADLLGDMIAFLRDAITAFRVSVVTHPWVARLSAASDREPLKPNALRCPRFVGAPFVVQTARPQRSPRAPQDQTITIARGSSRLGEMSTGKGERVPSAVCIRPSVSIRVVNLSGRSSRAVVIDHSIVHFTGISRAAGPIGIGLVCAVIR